MDNDDNMDNMDNNNASLSPSGYVVNEKHLLCEYAPFFTWFYNHRKLLSYIHWENQNCRLPVLLKLIRSLDETMIEPFKKFYGLTDDSIKDDEYSKQFLIYIEISLYDSINEEDDRKYGYIYTGFEITLNKGGNYIRDREVYQRRITNF